jgi:ribosomal protein S18 acetylase RimI-like enzyme
MAAMLVEAAYPPWIDPKPTPDEALSNPHSARYLRSWGRAGDLGVIAEDQSGPIGAAWCRLLPASEPGYGFVAEDVPEISIAVLAEHRGEGVGRRLLAALIEDASSQGIRALSLSVHHLNPVAVHIYERAGFVRVGGTDTMRVMLVTLPAGGLPRRQREQPPGPA